jgi:membrane complex biogenesis BtpA family protein
LGRPTFAELFRQPKPVIGMAHLPALPGTPRYVRGSGIAPIVESLRRDLGHLLDGGVDGVLFCNEDDRPYSLRVGSETVAVMAAVIAQVRPTDVPFGVDVLWDAQAALAIAQATGAAFMREVVTGAYESDMGLWAPDAAGLYRYRAAIDADDVLVLANITPEFASPLGHRSVGERARSAVTSSLVDALLISGPMAGAEPDVALLREASEAVAGQVPVLLNTGARVDNVRDYLAVADGVIVGSGLKVDGRTWNPVDLERVRAFIEQARQAR